MAVVWGAVGSLAAHCREAAHITRFGAVRDCVAYGPGILDLAHQPDEWVGIEDMIVSAKVMAATALTLLLRASDPA